LLLASSIARVLDAESLTRRHWQVLNTIALGARTPEEADAARNIPGSPGVRYSSS
jgi:hypothetical protein